MTQTKEEIAVKHIGGKYWESWDGWKKDAVLAAMEELETEVRKEYAQPSAQAVGRKQLYELRFDLPAGVKPKTVWCDELGQSLIPAVVQPLAQPLADIADITDAMREADRAFEKVGGGTRHYLRDCFLPLLEQRNMAIIKMEGKGQPSTAKESETQLVVQELQRADETLSGDGYKAWGYVRLALARAEKLLSVEPSPATPVEGEPKNKEV